VEHQQAPNLGHYQALQGFPLLRLLLRLRLGLLLPQRLPAVVQC
jgi:hypothetical protein